MRPLVAHLDARGLSVWLDERKIRVGDSLRGSIEGGLAHSRFGVVVISPAFPTKLWAQRELDGLVAKEVNGGVKVILPVWHEVDVDYVAEHFPILADRLGAPTSNGIPWVAEQIELALKAEDAGPASLSPPPASRRRVTGAFKRRLSSRGLGGFGLLSIAAAAIAFAATPSGPQASPATLPNSVSTPDLEISFPAGWRRAAKLPPAPGAQLTAPVALESAGKDSLIVGSSHSSSPTLLPESLLRQLPRVPRGEAVRIGSTSFYRYPDLRPAGATVAESIYAQPTTSGILLGVCRRGSVASPSFPVADCERMLGSVQLAKASSLPLGPQVPYAVALSRVFSRLNSVRQRDGRKLANAGTTGAQALAGAQLAAAHTQAAESLRTTTPGPAEGEANEAAIKGLEQIAAGYAAMAEAARAGHGAGFSSGRLAVRSGTVSADRALRRLSQFGYRVGAS